MYYLPNTYIQSMFVSIKSLEPPNGNISDRESNLKCLFPADGQCTTSPSVSAIIGRSRFGTAPFTLPLIPDRCHGTRAVFNVSSSRESLLTLFLFHFIVETLNCENIMSTID